MRASRVLACVASAKAPWTLDELAAAVEVPKDTLLGILNTLIKHGMLRIDGGGLYQLGFAWLRLATLRRSRLGVREIALPLMRQMGDAVGETIILSTRVGDQRVHIEYVESPKPIRRLAQIGNGAPLHIGAAGLALLACQGPASQQDYVTRLRSSQSDAEIGRLEVALSLTSQQGFALAAGTVNPDTAAVAAAMRTPAGEAFAITISCPTERFTPTLKAQCVSLIQTAVAQLSSQFGVCP